MLKKEDETITSLMTSGNSLIVVGNCDKAMDDALLEADRLGRPVSVLNLYDPSHSHCYNPLVYAKTYFDIEKIEEAVIPDASLEERTLFEALTLYLKDNKELSKEFKNFSNVIKLLRAAEVDEDIPYAQSPLDKLFAKIEDEKSCPDAVFLYEAFKKYCLRDRKTAVARLMSRLRVFRIDTTRYLTERDEMDLKNFLDSNRAVFIILGNNKTLNSLSELLIEQTYEIAVASVVRMADVYRMSSENEALDICKLRYPLPLTSGMPAIRIGHAVHDLRECENVVFDY